MKHYELTFSLRSPFARRIRLALSRLEFPFNLIEENVLEPSPEFERLTPLGLVPALRTPEGVLLTDSNNLLEVLNDRSGGKIWPEDQEHRELVRQASVYATGVMTFIVSHFLETIQPSPSEAFMKDCEAAVRDTMQLLCTDPEMIAIWSGASNENPSQGFSRSLNQASWDIAVAAQYASIRFKKWDWAAEYPELAKHVEECMKDSEFAASAPPPPPLKK
ncbi:MAG: glutathione S-transferase family protein [Xanthomonadaceae bacterium]|nr:glutathione S-transferase family protein [Xanthomonadaceae bacterium]